MPWMESEEGLRAVTRARCAMPRYIYIAPLSSVGLRPHLLTILSHNNLFLLWLLSTIGSGFRRHRARRNFSEIFVNDLFLPFANIRYINPPRPAHLDLDMSTAVPREEESGQDTFCWCWPLSRQCGAVAASIEMILIVSCVQILSLTWALIRSDPEQLASCAQCAPRPGWMLGHAAPLSPCPRVCLASQWEDPLHSDL